MTEGGIQVKNDLVKLEDWAREKTADRELIAAKVYYN